MLKYRIQLYYYNTLEHVVSSTVLPARLTLLRRTYYVLSGVGVGVGFAAAPGPRPRRLAESLQPSPQPPLLAAPRMSGGDFTPVLEICFFCVCLFLAGVLSKKVRRGPIIEPASLASVAAGNGCNHPPSLHSPLPPFPRPPAPPRAPLTPCYRARRSGSAR